MSDYVIKVENLSKSYLIRHEGRQDTTMRDLLSNRVKGFSNRLLGRANGHIQGTRELFWALNDVAFEVKQGERVGVIGRNGAGKSTLLKILSRITDPTKGRVHIKGRVASLLEVGTGFHPELSGRENIFLNGAILGMSRLEIRRKFDEIVTFAEVEKFLDTPVKHYSSGMYVRLAFAVAAYLEPEILVVDEVLAVGDVQFQQKCLGKMQNVTEQEGRTVLFVSHNMEAIRTLCTKVLHLQSGQIAGIGAVDKEIQGYLRPAKQSSAISPDKPYTISHDLCIQKLKIAPATIVSGVNVQIELDFYSKTIAFFSEISVLIYSATGVRVAILDLRKADVYHKFDPFGQCSFLICIKSLPLVEGEYSVGLYLRSTHVIGDFLELTKFTVYPQSTPSNGIMPYQPEHRGLIELDYTFS